MIRNFAIAVFAVFSAGCSTSSTDAASTGTGTEGPFLAFAKDFEGFRSWTSTPAGSSTEPASTHTTGPRTAYINHEPKSGSTEFPVGTIIVKESSDGPIASRTVFAMVKRGGSYNQDGAPGWEWFELTNLDESKVSIVWRGVGPPIGEKYGGDPNGGCNGCHGASRDDDFVQTSGLHLNSF
jgi:hypothetical protein